jgi:hypothetical protein
MVIKHAGQFQYWALVFSMYLLSRNFYFLQNSEGWEQTLRSTPPVPVSSREDPRAGSSDANDHVDSIIANPK